MTTLKAGDPAPDFTARTTDGKTVSLADFRGKKLVMYFYPKDDTPGCTKEACGFRDAWDELQQLGAVVLGVSADDAAIARVRPFAGHTVFLCNSDGGREQHRCRDRDNPRVHASPPHGSGLPSNTWTVHPSLC